MQADKWNEVENARKAALEVLLHNANGPYHGLPRTAGWGYPEPYTRDLLLAVLGIAVSDDKKLIKKYKKVLEVLAENQTPRGHITSLVHDKDDVGASDTTPLFLLGVGIYRNVLGDPGFLAEAVEKALLWMEYQSPSDRYLVAQQPTSDWRDEQWVIGYGLFVNAITYGCLRILGRHDRAEKLKQEMIHFTITADVMHRHVHEGLIVKHKPYFAFWSYKLYSSERFDLLGNSLAILFGLASPTRAFDMISWIEDECTALQHKKDLLVDLPPNFFPFIKETDPDWRDRYLKYNKPGDYHNGGVWPFICGLYIAAIVATKRYKLAEKKLCALTNLIKRSVNSKLEYGFNEWVKAQTGQPMGQDWQTWSAALYLYAVKCVEEKRTFFFDDI
jgi:hypothetical protein